MTYTGKRYKPGDLVRLASDPHGQHGEIVRWNEAEMLYRVDWLTPMDVGLQYMTSVGDVEERDLIPATIDTSIWEPATDPGDTGYLKLVRKKTVREVYAELVALVGELGDGHNEYLSVMAQYGEDMEWPEGTIMVTSVNGSSEGDYTRIGVVTGLGEFKLLILGKTFDGRDASWRFARQCADIFEA